MSGFYVMSMWYKRAEAQKRFSFFVSAATFAGAFGSLLATAIGHMNKIRGYHAWRWIFILEGILTCVLSLAAYFLVPNFPEDAKWLNESDRAFVIQRLAIEQGESHLEQRIDFRGVLQTLSDPKTILAGFMYFGPTMSGYRMFLLLHPQRRFLISLQVSRTSFQQSYLLMATRPSSHSSILYHPGLQHLPSPCALRTLLTRPRRGSLFSCLHLW